MSKMQSQHLFITGINHRTASLKERSPLTWSKEKQRELNLIIQKKPWIKSHILIVTCNRTEIIYLSISNENTLKPWCIEQKMPEKSIYHLEDKDAIIHILQTLTGINSMIIGETEIIGQYKTAVSLSYQQQVCTSYQYRLMCTLFNHAKKIRQQTLINTHRVPLSHRTFHRMRQNWRNIDDCKILFIGAGTIITNHLIYLRQLKHTSKITILCKNPEKHTQLSRQYDSKIDHIDQLRRHLETHDCVISATASADYIITNKTLLDLSKKPKQLFDLAMPQDIEPINQTLSQECHLITIEDLSIRNTKEMEKSIDLTKKIIQKETVFIANSQKIENHSVVIKQFRKGWQTYVDTTQKRTPCQYQYSHVLRKKMCLIHQALHITQTPPEYKGNHTESIQSYSKKLLHLPTMKIKTIIQNTKNFQQVNALIQSLNLTEHEMQKA